VATLDAGLVALCASLDADAVKEIIDTDLTDARINAFLNAAYYLTRPISGELGDCGGGDAECEIIKWVAAHLMTAYERQTKSESVAGEWSVSFMAKDGMGLESSLYGQNVLVMDCSGLLSKATLKRPIIEFFSYEDLEEDEPSSAYYD
jgi:hypothetical protein